MKRILITGANSYIGVSFEEYMSRYGGEYTVDTVDMIDDSWREKDFSSYDVVFHVAGIAHSDNGKISEEKKKLYYSVNTDLTVETAKKAKSQGVGQFIFMSSAIVYGSSAPIGEVKRITKDTPVSPDNCYSDSKVLAEKGLRELEDDSFKVVILRPPMIYGRGCKGNYKLLSRFAKVLPVFPYVENERSMLYIDNLTEFVRLVIDNEEKGVFWPQNPEYTNTSQMVSLIGKSSGKKVTLLKGFSRLLKIASRFTGLVNKAFGNLSYDMAMSVYSKGDYQLKSLEESIEEIEKDTRPRLLVLSQYFYPEQFRINDMCTEWVKMGYKVTVLTGIPNYPQGKFFEGYGLFKKRRESWNGMDIVRIPLVARGSSALGMVLNYFSFVVSGWFWKTFTPLKADKVFMFEVSPMTQALVGVWFAKRRKIPCALYVQDLWPENVEIVTGIHNELVLNPIRKMVRYIYKNCDVIYGTSPSFVEKIKEQVADNKEKVVYLPQYAEDFYKPCERKGTLFPDNGNFKVVFTGNIGQAQGLDILPKTAELLKKQDAKITFVIVGDGRYKEKLLEEISQRDVEDMFIFTGRKPAEEIPSILVECDAAFVSFMNNELFNNTIPAKLQSYMACAMPVIASADGETRQIIESAQCGICSPIGDSHALAQSIIKMAENRDELKTMGENSLEYSTQNFNKTAILGVVEEFLR